MRWFLNVNICAGHEYQQLPKVCA